MTRHSLIQLLIITKLSTDCFILLTNDGYATTPFYPLSLHDALPICRAPPRDRDGRLTSSVTDWGAASASQLMAAGRSEEHTSELQSHSDVVCSLLLEKKNSQ